MSKHKSLIFKSILYFIMAVFLIITILPAIWMISTSLKFPQEIFAAEVSIIPNEVNWNNYVQIFERQPFARFLFNSAVMTFFIIWGRLILVSMAAYAFAKVKFVGRELLFLSCLATLIIPEQVNMIPNYITLAGWGLINTYPGIILPYFGLGVAFGIFLLRQHFLTIPEELRESALLDGCGHIRFFLQVVIPLSKPVISAYIIFVFLEAWNAYLWPLIVTHDIHMRPAQVALAFFQSEAGAEWGLIMAGSVIVTLPTLILFLIFQNKFIESITMSGLKG